MATALPVEKAEVFQQKVVGLGEVTLSKREANEYQAEFWEGFAYWLGGRIIEKYKDQIPSECTLLFLPAGINNLENLSKKQNTNFLGESVISPLFHIEYDKNLKIENCYKKEQEIPTKMRFMILC